MTITLRSRVIRLAASLPKGSEPRRRLLEVLRTAADEGGASKVEKLFDKYELRPEDLADLAMFVLDLHPENQPDDIVTEWFTNWWGGKLPSYWKALSKKDLLTLIRAMIDAVPGAAAIMEKAPKKNKQEKKGSLQKTGTFSTLMTVAVLSASRHRYHAPHKSYQSSRNDRAQERDSNFSPPPKKPAWTRYSYSKGAETSFDGTAEEFAAHNRDEDYADAVWAHEKLGKKPPTRKEYDEAIQPSVLGADEVRRYSQEETHRRIKDKAVNQLSRFVREGVDAGHEGKDLAKHVEKKMDDHVQTEQGHYQRNRKEWLKTEFKYEDNQRFWALVNEEEAGASIFDKLVKIVDPVRYTQTLETRARKKHEQEWTEGKGPRSYDDYAAEKKKHHEPPMSRKEWESRYKK